MNKKTKRAIETEQITITIDSELLYKYRQICKHYGHDLNEQIIFTMINYVHSFEINNGPILRGRDIKRYGYEFADLWLINTHNGIKDRDIPPVDINEYPSIKAHLDMFYDKISSRYDKGDTPYNLRNCIYTDDFSKQKIVWGNLSLSSQFSLVGKNVFLNAPSSMIVPANKYILAVLNSKLGDWYIRQLGVTRNGGYFEYKPMFIEQLPVPQIPSELEVQFCLLVDDIISAKQNNLNMKTLEKKLNQAICDLYNLDANEIDYIMNF